MKYASNYEKAAICKAAFTNLEAYYHKYYV